MDEDKGVGKEKGEGIETSSLSAFFEDTASRVSNWVWAPQKGTFRKKRFLWILTRIIFIVIGESKKDRLALRASSLTFTVVLSLVPTLALGTAVLKGLGAGNQMKQAAYRMIDQMERGGGLLSATPPPASRQAPGTAAGQSSPMKGGATVTSHLKKATDAIFGYVERTNFATLGAFGVAGLILTVLSLLGNIENSMNAIWQAHSGRPLGRKMIDYLSLMVLLPVTVNLTLATETILQSPRLFARIQQIIPILWLQSLLLTLLPIFIVVCTFTLLYRFLPNTRVGFLPALAGGLAGGAGWFLLQTLYVTLQIGVARYNAIYGSFATLPLFLVWIYMGWLVFLAGAEVAFAVQIWPQYTPAGVRLTPLKKLTIAFETVAAVFETFQQRGLTTKKLLSITLNRPEGHIREILEDLEEAGIIHHVQEKRREGFVPAAPMEALPASDIIRMVLGPEQKGELLHPLTRKALDAALAAVAGKKIKPPPYLGEKEKGLPEGISQTSLFPAGPEGTEPESRAEPAPPETTPPELR